MSDCDHSSRMNEDYESEDESDDDVELGEWQPGDGICPSVSEFNAVYESSFRSWRSAAQAGAQLVTLAQVYLDQFLKIL